MTNYLPPFLTLDPNACKFISQAPTAADVGVWEVLLAIKLADT